MKRFLSLVLIVAFAMCFMFTTTGCSEKTKLFVYNVGDYIDPALIDMFEDRYPHIEVVYELYNSNEEMYMKVSKGTSAYDVIFPSDYMLEQMIDEGLINKLNFENIPNYKYVDPNMKTLDYDPTGEYSVPYMWGTMGILYNTTMMDEVPDSWDYLWDEKYADNILMLNQERDMISIALKKCGFSMNSNNDKELKIAEDALRKQRSIVKAYCGDEIKDNMVNGVAAMAIVWSGDAFFCIDQNPDLAYSLPKEGSNLFIDCMAIPTTSKHQKEAELFINFLSDPEIAKINTDYIGYSTSNVAAREMLDEEIKNDWLRYPELNDEFMKNMEIFAYDKERNAKLFEIWIKALNS